MRNDELWPELWPVGEGGYVAAARLVAVGRLDSAPIRRAVRKAKVEGRLVDLSFGKACHWVFFLDSGHIILGTTFPLEDTRHDRDIQDDEPVE